MKLWCVPEGGEQATELVVMAETREEAIEKARGYFVATRYRANSRDHYQYEETTQIDGDVYDEPMFGYSW